MLMEKIQSYLVELNLLQGKNYLIKNNLLITIDLFTAELKTGPLDQLAEKNSKNFN